MANRPMFRCFRAALLAWALLLSPASSAEEDVAVTFALSEDEVSGLQRAGNAYVIALTPEASARFARFTAENIGKTIEVVVAGVTVVRARGQAEIGSGHIQTRPLDEGARKHLLQRLGGG